MSNLVGLQMNLRRVDDHTAIVEFSGELDILTSVKARELLTALFSEGCRQLLVNLRHTNYIDSSGLGTLVSTLRKAREKGGGVHIIGLSGRVRRLFEITRLMLAFPIYSNEQEALERISGCNVTKAA